MAQVQGRGAGMITISIDFTTTQVIEALAEILIGSVIGWWLGNFIYDKLHGM